MRGIISLKSLNLTNDTGYLNKNKKSNKAKTKPFELYELAGKKTPNWKGLY
jgi:hypothetical protein